MPKLKTELYGGGDHSWLGSSHGIGNARTVALDPSTFTKETHYPDGYLPSGLPLTITGGKAGPYDGVTLDGFLLTDQTTDGETDILAPVLDHGRVITSRLPGGAFVAPGTDKTTVVFV